MAYELSLRVSFLSLNLSSHVALLKQEVIQAINDEEMSRLSSSCFLQVIASLPKALEEIDGHLSTVRRRHVMEGLPPNQDPESADQCSICLEGHPEDPTDCTTLCNHKFHTSCVLLCFESEDLFTSCPNCRSPLAEEDLSGVIIYNSQTQAAWNDCEISLKEASQFIGVCRSWIQCFLKMCSAMKDTEELREAYYYERLAAKCFNTFPLNDLKDTAMEVSRRLNIYRVLRLGLDQQ